MEKLWLSDGCEFTQDFFEQDNKTIIEKKSVIFNICQQIIEGALKHRIKSMRIKIEAEIEK